MTAYMNGWRGLVVVLITVGYVALTIMSLLKWNDATSNTLILGFAFFAKEVVSEFFKSGATPPGDSSHEP